MQHTLQFSETKKGAKKKFHFIGTLTPPFTPSLTEAPSPTGQTPHTNTAGHCPPTPPFTDPPPTPPFVIGIRLPRETMEFAPVDVSPW